MIVFSEFLEMRIAHEHVINVVHFECHVVQTGNLALDAEEGMMIDESFAAVDPVEGRDDILFFAGIDLVRRHETKCLTEPLRAALHIRCHDDCMSQPLHVGRATLYPGKLAETGIARRSGIDAETRHRNFLQVRHAPNDLDLETVRFGQAHAFAATGSVQVFDP